MTALPSSMLLVPRIVIGLLGVAVVWLALRSAIRTFVIPRAVADPLSAAVFGCMRALFQLRLRFARDDMAIDRIMSAYAPLTLLLLLPVWLTLVLIGFMGIYWSIGITSLGDDFVMSGSSLLTLGYATTDRPAFPALSFIEATIGLILVALLIAYLPAMYTAFQRREAAVSQLASRAGIPPSAAEMITRIHRIGELQNLRVFWREWEALFAEIEESHTTLSALVFFRSPDPRLSWVTAAGAVLDAASLITSTVDIPREPQAALCIRAGFIALEQIARFFNVDLPADPSYPQQSISVSRADYDAVCRQLEDEGVPLKPDRDATWQDFAGWRVNYDAALLALCCLTLAPPAPWSSDRMPAIRLAPLRPRRKQARTP